MRLTILFLFFVSLSAPVFAEWEQTQLGYKSVALDIGATAVSDAPYLWLGVDFSTGAPAINLRAGSGGFHTKVCKDYPSDESPVEHLIALHGHLYRALFICTFGEHAQVQLFSFVDDLELMSIVQDAGDAFGVQFDGDLFLYDISGFAELLSMVEAEANEKASVELANLAKTSPWITDSSVYGRNKYGKLAMDLPIAKLFLSGNGTIQFNLVYGLFHGTDTAVLNCGRNTSDRIFKLPSIDVNHTKVRMFGTCLKYSDSDVQYLSVFPQTEAGRAFIVNTFKELDVNNAGYVMINDGLYLVGGFAQLLKELNASMEGI